MKPRGPAHIEEGMASWYGPGFHGKTTSNKEVYDMYDMTAAHRTLPFGTHLIVTNLQNGRSVTVRINDRGPFVNDRIIDLSYAAAFQLDMLGPGVVQVRIEVIPDISPDPAQQKFCVQVGSFSVQRNASLLRNRLKKTHPGAYISRYSTPAQTYYRVRIKADSREQTLALARLLQSEGYRVLILEEH
jgi:rare lipoprotein A